ncbi:MAG TPA: HAD hydrolase-like protein [Bacilli bacterium]|nr:HAD hydrolase-like protein [Bacilli bacterium]
MQKTPFQAILFDIDGTLYQTEKVALPAFRQTFDQLRDQNLFHGDTPADDKLTGVFGMTIPEVWETLLPDGDMDTRDKANELFAHAELSLMEAGKGELYPGVREALAALHNQNIRLYTCSNGEQRYVETVIRTQHLTPLFTKLYSAGAYKTEEKAELVARILQDQNLSPDTVVMVGDRKSDILAGNRNRVLTIGCDFGFASADELRDASIKIDQFDQLQAALDKLAHAMVK